MTSSFQYIESNVTFFLIADLKWFPPSHHLHRLLNMISHQEPLCIQYRWVQLDLVIVVCDHIWYVIVYVYVCMITINILEYLFELNAIWIKAMRLDFIFKRLLHFRKLMQSNQLYKDNFISFYYPTITKFRENCWNKL